MDTTERLHFHFSLSCIGEGNGNPLQCSCLENPRDGGAWWAAVYGVAQSWTQLRRLSSSRLIIQISEALKVRFCHPLFLKNLWVCFLEGFLIFAHEFIIPGPFCENYFEAKVEMNFSREDFVILFVSVLWPLLVCDHFNLNSRVEGFLTIP